MEEKWINIENFHILRDMIPNYTISTTIDEDFVYVTIFNTLKGEVTNQKRYRLHQYVDMS